MKKIRLIYRIEVLVWANILVEIVLWLMVIYLSEIWGLDITHASAIVNGFTGLENIMPIGLSFLANAYVGDKLMLFVSSLAYSFGMVLLITSTRLGVKCFLNEPTCIDHTHKVLFYTALTFKAVGVSGFKVSLRPFLDQQDQIQAEGDGNQAEGDGNQAAGDGNQAEGDGNQAEGDGNQAEGDGNPPEGDGNQAEGDRNPPEGDGNQAERNGNPAERDGNQAERDGNQAERNGNPAEHDGCRAKMFRFVAMAVSYIVVLAVSFFVSTAPWAVLFDMATIVMVGATIMFITGCRSYRSEGPRGSPLATVCRVFVASAFKIFHPQRQANGVDEEERKHSQPHAQGLRNPESAAITSQTQTQGNEPNRWRLCSLNEVEEAKIFLRMIPLWMTFIMSGIVTSVGDTYFIEQADNMNKKVGKLEVPVFVLQIIYEIARKISTYLYTKISTYLYTKEGRTLWAKYVGAFGIAVSMLISIACFMTAAKVERRRLGETESLSLLDSTDGIIPMTMFWLLPQFFLLASHDGMSDYLSNDVDKKSNKSIYSVACSSSDQVPTSIIPALKVITEGVFGAGTILNVLLVYAVAKLGERGGKLSWFQDTVNESRLDKYYLTMAVLSSTNFVFCILVAFWYAYRRSSSRGT